VVRTGTESDGCGAETPGHTMSDPSSVPKLPGYFTEDPTTRRTTHSKTLEYKSGFTYVHPLEGNENNSRSGVAPAAQAQAHAHAPCLEPRFLASPFARDCAWRSDTNRARRARICAAWHDTNCLLCSCLISRGGEGNDECSWYGSQGHRHDHPRRSHRFTLVCLTRRCLFLPSLPLFSPIPDMDALR